MNKLYLDEQTIPCWTNYNMTWIWWTNLNLINKLEFDEQTIPCWTKYTLMNKLCLDEQTIPCWTSYTLMNKLYLVRQILLWLEFGEQTWIWRRNLNMIYKLEFNEQTSFCWWTKKRDLRMLRHDLQPHFSSCPIHSLILLKAIKWPLFNQINSASFDKFLTGDIMTCSNFKAS
jgi:hypothetical protein